MTDNQLDQSILDFSMSPSFSNTQAAYYTDVSVSLLPSLMPAVSPQRFPSSRRPTRRMPPSIFANENSQSKQEVVGAEKTDVCVKWKKLSNPADGKLICIVNVSKTSTLWELREEVEAHISVWKKNFKFLFLKESGVRLWIESLRVTCALDRCPALQEGLDSRLACMRPPVRENSVFASSKVESQPFRALEKSAPWRGLEQVVVVGAGKLMRGSPTPLHGRGSPATKGLRPLNGELGRPKSALAHIVESSPCM